MDTITAISERMIMTRFKKESLPNIIIENILNLATKAPSGQNRQPWKFTVLQEEKLTEFLSLVKENNLYSDIDLANISNSSAIVLVFNSLYNEEGYSEESLITDSISIGTAIQNILLATQAFSLGSLLLSDIVYLDKEVAEWLDEDNKLVSSVVIGFPDDLPESKPKEHFSKVTDWYR